ncbi:MAG: hypothetical protein K2K16_10500 [Ruminococcus sp.]|nr:hypothetical protein [Ruminococcus sp.]
MKSKKLNIIGTLAVYAVLFSLIAGFIYFDTHYTVINKKIFRNDIKTITGTNLTKKDDIDCFINFNITDIREVNKCTELEEMNLLSASDNIISKLNDFHNLKYLTIMNSDISSADCEKISQFDNLQSLEIHNADVDFKGFNSDTISYIELWGYIKAKNFEVLSECESLKNILVWSSEIHDNNIIEDISVFTDFDYIESLSLSIDRIEDISGILEMDSLKTLEVKKDAISEDNVKLLEDKGVTVTYY